MVVYSYILYDNCLSERKIARKTLMKNFRNVILMLLVSVFLLLLAGCAEAGDKKTEENGSSATKKVTVERLLAANHPDKRLEKADNILLERKGDGEYILYTDTKGTLFESFPDEGMDRLTVELSYQITKTGESFKKNTVPYVSPEEEWYPFLLFPSSLSHREKIQKQEEKDGKLSVTTRLSGDDYDIALNREDNVTDRCETVYTVEKESLKILSYKTTIYLLDGTSTVLETHITENANEPNEVAVLAATDSTGTISEEEPDENDEGDDPSDSPESPSGNSSSGSSSSDSSSSDSTDSDDPNSESSVPMPWFYENDKELNLLLIGNSYSSYWPDELWGLLNSAGHNNVSVCNVYYSGCTFEQHWTWYENGVTNYKFVVHDNDGRTEYKSVGLTFCLSWKNWDAISLQQSNKWAGSESGHRNSITPYIPKLNQLLRSSYPKAKIYWQQDWAHEIGKGSITAVKTQETHARVYLEVGMEFCKQYGFTMVPLGEAWPLVRHDPLFYATEKPVSQNYPTKSLHTRILNGEIVNTDLSHDGDVGGGQYLNACVWFEMLTNTSVVGNKFRPEYECYGRAYTLTEEQITALQNAAHTAVENTRKKGYIT